MLIGTGIKLLNPPFIGGSEDGWLAFWGSLIGTAIGVIGAYFVMRMQLEIDKKPILGFLNRNETKFESDSKLEMTSINGGITPIFNVVIAYELSEKTKKEINYNEIRKKEFMESFDVIYPQKEQTLSIPREYCSKFLTHMKKKITGKTEEIIFEVNAEVSYEDYNLMPVIEYYIIYVVFRYLVSEDLNNRCSSIIKYKIKIKKVSNQNVNNKLI
jgi:hypothetical protein